MGCYRPKYPSANYQPSHRRPIPRTRPRSPLRPRPSSPTPAPAQSPWSFDTQTRAIFWDGRRLDPWERELAILATRYPDRFDPAVSRRGVSRKHRPDFTEEEWKLLEVIKRWPLDLDTGEFEGVDKERRYYMKYSELEIGGGASTTDVPNVAMMDQPPLSSNTADGVASTSTSTAQPPTDTSKATNPTSKSPHPLSSNSIPWSHDPRTGNIFANGTRLTCFERKIVLLASRHPDRVKDNTSFVRAGDAPLSDHEFALITAAATHPIDLTALANHYPSLPAPEPWQPKRQELPKIRMDRAPWTVDKAARVVWVDGEVLTVFERELVVRASIYPSQFKKTGEYKVGGKLTGWEKELVRAARKWPMETDLQDIEELRAKGRERDGDEEKGFDKKKEPEKVPKNKEEKKTDEDENVEMEDAGEVVQEADEESAKQPVKKTPAESTKAPAKETSTPDLSKSKWAAGKSDRHTHDTTPNPNPPPTTRPPQPTPPNPPPPHQTPKKNKKK